MSQAAAPSASPQAAIRPAVAAEPGVAELDISAERCPNTYIKASLFLEDLPAGARATILVSDDEAIAEVPEALREAGHTITASGPAAESPTSRPNRTGRGLWRVAVSKAAAS